MNEIEEKILQELKEIKKELQDIRSTLEPKDNNLVLNTIESQTKLLELQIKRAKEISSSIL